MTSYPDNSGSKNLIQQNASATTYLMRYTLIMALGLTTADEDIDARMPETFEYITDDELANLEDLVGSYVTNRSKLMEFLGVKELSHLKRSQYQNAVQAIKMKGSKK